MRLQFLELNSCHLSKLESFYIDILGFPLLKKSENSFSFQAGETVIKFKESEEKAYYHFAFNIPMDQIEEAANWLEQEKNIDILAYKGKRIIDFSAWDAKALYFYDPAGNIVELIARRPLGISKTTTFNIEAIISLSEIGLALVDVEQIVLLLEEISNLEIYSGDRDLFCAMGSPQGLFIMVDQAKKTWIPKDDPAKAFPLKVHFEQKEQMFILETNSESLTITKA